MYLPFYSVPVRCGSCCISLGDKIIKSEFKQVYVTPFDKHLRIWTSLKTEKKVGSVVFKNGWDSLIPHQKIKQKQIKNETKRNTTPLKKPDWREGGGGAGCVCAWHFFTLIFTVNFHIFTSIFYFQPKWLVGCNPMIIQFVLTCFLGGGRGQALPPSPVVTCLLSADVARERIDN